MPPLSYNKNRSFRAGLILLLRAHPGHKFGGGMFVFAAQTGCPNCAPALHSIMMHQIKKRKGNGQQSAGAIISTNV